MPLLASSGRRFRPESGWSGRGRHRLNSWLLNAAVSGLDLVAIDDGQIIGHVLGAYGSLNEHRVVGVAPLAVVPHHQSEGIGSGLMSELLRQAEGSESHSSSCSDYPPTTDDSALRPLGRSASTAHLSVLEIRTF